MTLGDIIEQARSKLKAEFTAGRLDAENAAIREDFSAIVPSIIDLDSVLYRSLLKPTEGKCDECGIDTGECDPDDNTLWLCEDCLQALNDETREFEFLHRRGHD